MMKVYLCLGRVQPAGSTIKEVNNCDLGVLEKSKVVGVVVEVLVVAVVVVFSRIVDGVVLHLVFSFSI